MVDIRNLELKDLQGLEKLHDQYSEFPIPQPSNKNNVIQKAITFDGELIGACFVWRTTELSLTINPNVSKLVRAKAIMGLFDVLFKELDELGFEDSHVFVVPEEDEQYAGLLKRKFNFRDAKGLPLYWRKNV